jgi:translation initiation factor IF-1
MVKNTHGGNKNKGQARKNVNTNTNGKGNNHSKVRISLNELEIYAQVTKFFGNRFEAKDFHGNTMNCSIPNKFRGRNIKDNKIAVNVWVLVGKRVWEVSNNPVYELMEVYNDSEKNYLKKNVHANWSLFESDDINSKTSCNMFEFGNDANEYTDIIQREAQLTSQKNLDVSTDWIDVEDI